VTLLAQPRGARDGRGRGGTLTGPRPQARIDAWLRRDGGTISAAGVHRVLVRPGVDRLRDLDRAASGCGRGAGSAPGQRAGGSVRMIHVPGACSAGDREQERHLVMARASGSVPLALWWGVPALAEYLTSSSFAVDVVENWQSEYLQFFLDVLGTVWLVQKGSPESKEMGVIVMLTWLAQSVAGRVAYNAEQLGQLQDPVSWLGYLGAAEFWNRTPQNWQSELLAVGSFAVIAVYLRQRGSPASKSVGAAHGNTGQTG
jgi:hypothetical protein